MAELIFRSLFFSDICYSIIYISYLYITHILYYLYYLILCIYILYQCVWFIQSNVFVWPGLVVWGQNGPGEDGWTRGTIDRRSHPAMENFWNMFGKMFGKWLVVATKATSWFARFGVFDRFLSKLTQWKWFVAGDYWKQQVSSHR